MKATAKRAALLTVAVLGTAGAALAANPLVSDVTMTHIPNTRMARITYTLANAPAIITLSIETNGVAIPDSAVTRLSGDACRLVQPGADKSIVWNAGVDWPENLTALAKARVVAWYTNASPQYCAVDVIDGASALTYPVYYYTSAEGVPGGITNDIYKTTQILLRKLPATGPQGFKMGAPVTEKGYQSSWENWHDVVLTKSFYAGVYEVTQRQWNQVMGDLGWYVYANNRDYQNRRPMEQITRWLIREINNNGDPYYGAHDELVDWPNNDYVTADSFMGRLRDKTGLGGFDLPTEAQWEYACRAGTTGALNDGTISLSVLYGADAQLDPLGRYRDNGGQAPNGQVGPEHATATVGSYLPNAWGLYDMHGNVAEWCLDRVSGNYVQDKVTDPVGDTTGDQGVLRGGSHVYDAYYCRSAYRWLQPPHSSLHAFGFRLFLNVEPYLAQ